MHLRHFPLSSVARHCSTIGEFVWCSKRDPRLHRSTFYMVVCGVVLICVRFVCIDLEVYFIYVPVLPGPASSYVRHEVARLRRFGGDSDRTDGGVGDRVG